MKQQRLEERTTTSAVRREETATSSDEATTPGGTHDNTGSPARSNSDQQCLAKVQQQHREATQTSKEKHLDKEGSLHICPSYDFIYFIVLS